MKIKLSDIPEEGLTVSEECDPQALRLQTPEASFVGPLQVTADFHKERKTVLVIVGVLGDLDLTCGRCLSVYRQGYDEHFDFDYEIHNEIVLDVTDDVRQEILLSYPVKLLCKPECKGLCPQCGHNLNEGMCSHASAQA